MFPQAVFEYGYQAASVDGVENRAGLVGPCVSGVSGDGAGVVLGQFLLAFSNRCSLFEGDEPLPDFLHGRPDPWRYRYRLRFFGGGLVVGQLLQGSDVFLLFGKKLPVGLGPVAAAAFSPVHARSAPTIAVWLSIEATA